MKTDKEASIINKELYEEILSSKYNSIEEIFKSVNRLIHVNLISYEKLDDGEYWVVYTPSDNEKDIFEAKQWLLQDKLSEPLIDSLCIFDFLQIDIIMQLGIKGYKANGNQ